jgi:hypothetical protein
MYAGICAGFFPNRQRFNFFAERPAGKTEWLVNGIVQKFQ